MDDILNKPLTEITEDPFFRADNFENQHILRKAG